MSKAQAPRGPFRFDDAEVDDVDRFIFTAAATLHNAPITTSSTSTESKKSRNDESSSSSSAKSKGKDMSKDNGPAVPLPATDDGLLKVAAAGDGLVVVTPTGAMFVENTMRTAEDRVQGSPLVPCCLPTGVSLHIKSDGAFSLSEVPPDQSSAAPAKTTTASKDKDAAEDGSTAKSVSSKTADEDGAAKKEGDDKKDENAAVPADNNAHQFLQMPDGTHCAVMKVLSTRVVEAAGLGVVHKWGNVVPKIRKFSVSVLFSATLNGPASSFVKDGDVFVIVPVTPLQKFLKPFAPIDDKPQLALVFALKDEASWWLFAPTKPLPLDTPPDEFIRGHWMWPHTPTEPTKRVGSSMMLFRKDQGLAEKIQLHGAFARVEVKAVKQLGTRVFVLDNPDEVDVLYAKFLKREELRIAALKNTADDEDDEGPKGAPAKKTTAAKTGTKITAAAKANDKKAAPAKGKAAPKKKDTKVKAKTQRGKGKRDRDSDSDDDFEDSSDEFDDDSDETDETVTTSSDEDDLPMSQRFSLNITGSPVPTKKKATPAAAATAKKMATAPAASKITAAAKKTTARAGAVVAPAPAPGQGVSGNDVGVASERAIAGSFGCPPHAVQTFLVSDSAPCARNWDCPGSFPAAALRKLTRASGSSGGKKASAAGTNAADSSFFLLEMVSASSSSWTATAASGKKGGGNNKGSSAAKGTGASSSSVQFAVFAPAFAQPSESQPGGVSFWFVATGDRVSADQMRSQEAQPLPLQDVTKTTMSLRDAPPMLRVELETLQGAINTTAAAVKLDSVEDGAAFIGSELVTIAPGQFTAPRRSGGTGGGAGGSAISSLSTQQNSKSAKSANGGLIQDSATVMGGIQIGAVISSTEMTETICTGPDQFATILKRAAPVSINTTQSAARPAAAVAMITPDEMTSSGVGSEEILVASQTTEAAPLPPAPAAKKGRGRPPKARKLEVSSDDDLLAGKDSDEVSDDDDDEDDVRSDDEGGEDESDSDGLVDFDDDETSSGESEDSDEFPEMRRGKGRGRGGRAAATKSKASKQAGKSKSTAKKTAASKTAAVASASLGSTPAGKKDKKSAAPKPAPKQKSKGFALVRKTDLGSDEKDAAPSSQPPASSSRPAPAAVAANKTPTPPTAAAVPQPPAAAAPAAATAAEGDDEGALFAELLTSINAARMQE